MYTILASLIPLIAGVLAQDKNVTVADTDPSIVYAGNGTGPAAICQFNAGMLSGSPGCYFFPTNCTSSAAISQNLDHKATATFKFNGSAIYINSALTDASPVYTVTLDGQSTDVDGVRPFVSFTCAILFSQTGLSTTSEHTITLSVKGPSPNRNMTEDPAGVLEVFSLIDFIYTASNPTPSSSGAAGESTASVLLSTLPVIGVWAIFKAAGFSVL